MTSLNLAVNICQIFSNDSPNIRMLMFIKEMPKPINSKVEETINASIKRK